MHKRLKILRDYLMKGEGISLEIRFFRLITLTVSFIGIFLVLPANMFQGLSPYLNLAVALYGLATACLYYSSCRDHHYVKSFYGLTMLTLNVAWFLNGGSAGSISYFIFTAALYPLIFCRGCTRQIMFLLLVLDNCALLVVERYFPLLVTPYKSAFDRLIDLMLGFSFSACASALVFWAVVVTLERELEERKRAQGSLCQERDRAQGYLDTVETIIVALDVKGSITTINRKACQLLGYSEHELLGENWFDSCLPRPEGREVEFAFYARLVAGEIAPAPEHSENSIVTRAGERRRIVWHFSLLRDEQGRILGTLTSGEDVTERREAERALRKSEERFRSFVENANDIVYSLSLQGLFTYVSPNWKDVFGYEIPETVGKPYQQFIHPDDLDGCAAYFHRLMETGGKLSDIEFRVRHHDGTWFWYSAKAALLQDSDSNESIFLGIGRDISERKNNENALRESEQALRLKTALLEAQSNATLDGVLVVNNDRQRVFINRRFIELFEVPDSALIDESVAVLLKHVVSLVRQPEAFVKKVTYLHEHPNETSHDEVEFRNGMVMDRYSAPVLSAEGKHYGRIWTFRDITDEKLFEVERLKIEKLESLGVLAGGIAHDFNNILAGIMGGISFAQEFIPAGHPSYRPLETAEKASLRAAELARQLITFAKGGELVKKAVSVRHIVEESVSFALGGSNVKGSIIIPETLHAIMADEGQISQAFNNLIINAKQAMPEGGTVTVTALNVVLPALNQFGLPAGKYVKISCSDQGCGISEADLIKIFDPYFTTKTAGNGLGLASVYSILSKHGGSVTVSSVLGEGAAFTVYLPSDGEPCRKHEADPEAPACGVHTGGAVLVMDDDKIVRELTTNMLSHLGYQATTCEDGARAIALFKAAKASGTPFKAIIMDLTIPGGMGGKDAAEQILALDPQTCLIVSSGYSNDPVMSDFAAYGFSGAVAKPYRINDLGQLLSSVLGKGVQAA